MLFPFLQRRVNKQPPIQYMLLRMSLGHTNILTDLWGTSLHLRDLQSSPKAKHGATEYANMTTEQGRSRLLSANSPPWASSFSPVRHISLVARENMVTGFFPSTCLIIGSCPTRPSNWTRFMAETQESKCKRRCTTEYGTKSWRLFLVLKMIESKDFKEAYTGELQSF